MSSMVSNDEGGFVIFSGTKLWYSSKETSIKNVKAATTGKVRASAKSKRVVEFPIFDKMMEIEIDPYWKSLFDEAATGKFPRNFKFQNGVLNYKIRSKTIEQPIDMEDPKSSAELLKKFFLDTACIQSPEDLRRKKLEEEKKISEMIQNEVVSWSQIRSEKQRMIMLSLYVETIGKRYGLSIEERKGLVQNIRIGMLAGYFNTDTIDIVGNRIILIKGLDFNEESKEFEINKDICKIPKSNKKFATSMNCEDRSSLDYEDNSFSATFDEESGESTFESKESGSLHSSQSLKKRWNKFLSEISKK